MDILSKGFKIYSLIDYRSRIYTEYPTTLRELILQRRRYIENSFILHYQTKHIVAFLKIILLFITGFLIISGFGTIGITESSIEKIIFEIESIKFEELTINNHNGNIMLEIEQQNSQIYLPGNPILPAYSKTFGCTIPQPNTSSQPV